MIFRKSKEKVDKGVNKVDKIVTGLIIGGAVASIFGLSRTKKGKDISSKVLDNGKGAAKKSYSLFGRIVVRVLSFFFQ